MNGEILISVKNLTRVYGRGDLAEKVLDIKSLEIKKGDFTVITGPSGCGKTTLLNLLGTLDRPSGGEIIFGGLRLGGLGEAGLCRFRREKVGFVFQAYNLIPGLSALRNVLLPAIPGGGAPARRARELLRLVGLAGKENRRPGALSGGEQQRVAIARALMLDPELILADEPTGNLDSASGRQVIDLLKHLNRQGKTVIMATHDQGSVQSGHKTIRLADGRLVDEPAQ